MKLILLLIFFLLGFKWSGANEIARGWTQMSVSAVNEQLLNGFDFVLTTFLNSPLVFFRGYSCYNCLLDPI